MSMRLLRLVPLALSGIVLVGAQLLSGPPAAALSCVGTEHVFEMRPDIFTGTITDGNDHRIQVATDEVWKGVRPPARLWLDVDLVDWTPWADHALEIPDGYTSDRTWVFATEHGKVDACSAWLLRDVAEYRPATVKKALEATSADDADQIDVATAPGAGLGTGAIIGGGTGVGLAAAAGLFWWQRRRLR